jgi:8-oxo-dGTP pyrophosphatase MutT (NUDIX family)
MEPNELRELVRAQVASHEPVDHREAASLSAFLETFDALAEPFTETADITHVTGSAIVVSQRGVLLHLHKRAGIWVQPGGHVDEGEAPWEGAVRETLEETGLITTHPDSGPTLLHVDVHDAPKGHVHLDLRYLLLSSGEDPSPPEGESPHVEWVDWDDERLDRDSLRGVRLAATRWLQLNPNVLGP